MDDPLDDKKALNQKRMQGQKPSDASPPQQSSSDHHPPHIMNLVSTANPPHDSRSFGPRVWDAEPHRIHGFFR